MSDLSSKRKKSTRLTLIAAGILTASVCNFALGQSAVQSPEIKTGNPVAKRHLSDVRKLMKKKKWEKAVLYLQRHSSATTPQLLLEYGKLLARGWGTPRDLDKAREKLLMAVQHDFSKRGQAAFELAKVFLKSKGEDCTRIAFEWFAKSAQWGFGKAHAELGKHYARGIAVPVDTKKALYHYQLAGRSGSAVALLSFLKLIAKNDSLAKGLPPIGDLVVEMKPNLEAEALAGRASAAKALGRLYLDENLIARDEEQARIWLLRAAERGDSGAMVELAKLLAASANSQSDGADVLHLLKSATSLQDGSAYTESGRLHLSGKFGLKPDEAVGLFKKGVEHGHPGSMIELAKLLVVGKLVSPDREYAFWLTERAASFGHSGAKRFLTKEFSEDVLAQKQKAKTDKIAAQKQKPSSAILTGATVIGLTGKGS